MFGRDTNTRVIDLPGEKRVIRRVEFRYGKVFADFESGPRVWFEDGSGEEFAAVILALGGASYEKAPPRWPDTFRAKGSRVIPFQAANVGYAVDWPAAFLAEAEGLPLKNVAFTTARGTRVGASSRPCGGRGSVTRDSRGTSPPSPAARS